MTDHKNFNCEMFPLFPESLLTPVNHPGDAMGRDKFVLEGDTVARSGVAARAVVFFLVIDVHVGIARIEVGRNGVFCIDHFTVFPAHILILESVSIKINLILIR